MIIYIRSDRTQSVKAPDIFRNQRFFGRAGKMCQNQIENFHCDGLTFEAVAKRLLDMEWWKFFQQFADLEIDIELLFDEDIPAEL